MQFAIRAELPGSEVWDFTVAAEPRENGAKTPAWRVAREEATNRIKHDFGDDAQLDWRGMVVFVNRAVPCDVMPPALAKAARLARGYRS
jgi:hypothetical protein